MRELLEEVRQNKDRRASLAIEIFCYRVRKYMGAYLEAMGGADATVFTDGICENSPEIRSRVCAGLGWIGLQPKLTTECELAARHVRSFAQPA